MTESDEVWSQGTNVKKFKVQSVGSIIHENIEIMKSWAGIIKKMATSQEFIAFHL